MQSRNIGVQRKSTRNSRGMVLAESADMAHKIAIVLCLAILLAAGRSSGGDREPGLDETRAGMCEAFSGVAFGFCVALCEARQCDLQPPDDARCLTLRRGFDRVTGGVQPPC
jgi:hypothetical protein